jgi:hypothetical protein
MEVAADIAARQGDARLDTRRPLGPGLGQHELLMLPAGATSSQRSPIS